VQSSNTSPSTIAVNSPKIQLTEFDSVRFTEIWFNSKSKFNS